MVHLRRYAAAMRSHDRALELYDELLASIGERSAEIEPRPLVSHWPHVGSAYRGLVIVGQALRGWPDDWQASEARTAQGRQRVLAMTRARNADHPDPLDWVPSHPKVRNSPFWAFSRHLVDQLEPDPSVPWYARYAWVNLYPVAPESPPDNPGGPLKEAQQPFVGALLAAIVDMLEADRVVVVAGPQFWQPAADAAGLGGLPNAESPLIAAGRVGARRWAIGYHPKWASFQHFGAARYAALVADAVRRG
jgi:hypothetical protein